MRLTQELIDKHGISWDMAIGFRYGPSRPPDELEEHCLEIIDKFRFACREAIRQECKKLELSFLEPTESQLVTYRMDGTIEGDES